MIFCYTFYNAFYDFRVIFMFFTFFMSTFMCFDDIFGSTFMFLYVDIYVFWNFKKMIHFFIVFFWFRFCSGGVFLGIHSQSDVIYDVFCDLCYDFYDVFLTCDVICGVFYLDIWAHYWCHLNAFPIGRSFDFEIYRFSQRIHMMQSYLYHKTYHTSQNISQITKHIINHVILKIITTIIAPTAAPSDKISNPTQRTTMAMMKKAAQIWYTKI